MIHITHDEAPTFAAGGTTSVGYASPSRGASDTSVWRLELAPGSESPLHSLDREGVVISLEGTAGFTAPPRGAACRGRPPPGGGRAWRAPPGAGGRGAGGGGGRRRRAGGSRSCHPG